MIWINPEQFDIGSKLMPPRTDPLVSLLQHQNEDAVTVDTLKSPPAPTLVILTIWATCTTDDYGAV